MKKNLPDREPSRPRDVYRETIENLKIQTQKLKEEITLDSNAPLPVNTESYIARLQDQEDTFTKKIRQEKQKSEELDKKIAEVQKKIFEKKKALAVPKDKKNKETNETISLKIRKTEHKLEKTCQKFNEALANTSKLKTEINSLRNEKKLTKKFLKKLEIELTEKNDENFKAYEESLQVKKKSHDLRQEIEKIRKEKNDAEEEKAKLERNWQELNKRMDKEIRAQEMKVKKTSHDLEEYEIKMLEYLDENLIANEHDGKKNAKEIARKMKLFEDAFRKMEEETGFSDVEKILKIFVEAEEHNYSLFSHVNELAKDIQRLESQIIDMRKEIELYKNIGEKTAEERNAIIRELEEKLTDTDKRTDQDDKRYERNKKMINTFKVGVQQLMEKICEDEKFSEEGVNEGNLMQFLGIIELRTNEILQMFRLCQRSSNDSPVESVQPEEERKPGKVVPPAVNEGEHNDEEDSSTFLQRIHFIERANRILDNRK
jgi:chromosome segregation ATPase